MKNRKYITFSPYHSGLANVIMCYEIAFAISHITNRTLVIPPKAFSLFLSKSNQKKDFIDIWEIFDKKYVKKNSNAVDFGDVPEFRGNIGVMSGKQSYTCNISRFIDDVKEIYFTSFYDNQDKDTALCDSHAVITSGNFSDIDFNDFCQERQVLDLSKIKNKFIHFENNLFGHYWYHIYPGAAKERNLMKKKINSMFRYKQKFYELSSKVKSHIGEYNAVHVRRNDFIHVRSDAIESVESSFKLLSVLEKLYDPSIPLYIATDEKDKSFFDTIRKKYQIYFYQDFNFNLTELEETVVEQVICSEANNFYGTYSSTYSSRINVMRGIDGKPCDDSMGINHFPDRKINTSVINPWRYSEDKKWNWDCSSHPQWKIESNGIYI